MKKLLFFLLVVVTCGCNASQVVTDTLIEAADSGKLDRVLQLLNSGIDVDSRDQNGNTALRLAAINGHSAIAELLIMRGADVDSRDDEYRDTSLIWVVYHGNVHIAQLLLQHKAEINNPRIMNYLKDSANSDSDVVKFLKAVSAKTLVSPVPQEPSNSGFIALLSKFCCWQ